MTKLRLGVRLLALAVLVVGVTAVPSALADTSLGTPEGNGSGLWFVELNGAAAANGGSVSANKAEKAAFKAEAKKAGLSYTERGAFDTLWNGLSIKTTASTTTLLDIKGVKAVYPVMTESIPAPQAVDPNLVTAIQMTGADDAHAAGYDGAGVKVGIVDTGLDLDHPDLGGDGTNGPPYTNPRVVSQFDFVGDAYNADIPGSTPVPDPIADDCNGHGTHVSGIVGANGGAVGVAPGVKFGAYRVFGCAGSANDDVILAALEQAYADGMNVVNMSLGDAFNSWPEAPLAQASDTLLKNGVVVVASIGNSGTSGLYSNGAPGVGDGVIGVASFDNTFVNLSAATVTPVGLTVGWVGGGGSPAAPVSGSLPLTKANAIGNVPPGVLPAADGCAAVPAGTYTGMAVLIRRGTCGFVVKEGNAEAGGAAAVVLYNNTTGYLTPAATGIGIPVVFISAADGVLIHNAIASATLQTWNWGTGTVSVPNATGGTISDFSSWGLNAELTLKPDIGAPGGSIRSTYPIELGSYANLSGTSMASPHVAGAVALLLQAHPGTKAGDVRDILENSADPKNRFGQTYLDATHRQGAGMLDIMGSINATTTLSPGKISLGEGNGGSAKIKLTNSSGSPVTYDVSNEPAAGTTGSTFAPTYSTDYASASFSSLSVTVPGNGAANVTVTITPNPAMPDKGIYGGYIKFTPQGGGQEYRVPYAGFKGDYQSIQVLTPTANGFPWLARLTGPTFIQVPPAANVFTMTDPLNEPHFVMHFDHPARSLAIDVYEVGKNKWVGTAITRDYLSRNSTATAISDFPWDGTAKKGQGNSYGNAGPVADGTYYAVLTLTKALGTKKDVETWTSPNFVIDRP